MAKEHGADEVINYTELDLKDTVKELTGGSGVDVVYDPVGGDVAEPALRVTRWNGRYLVDWICWWLYPQITYQFGFAQRQRNRRCVLGHVYS